MLTKVCVISGAEFVVTDEDLEFYKKMDVPVPDLCSDEREMQRMAIANQRNLYHRTCSGSGKKIISMFSEEKEFPVYDVAYFWSDDWDPRSVGKEFDFHRPFFDQLYDLHLVAPRPALLKDHVQDENSDFTNFAGLNKDCYLMFDSDMNRDCYYGYGVNRGVNLVDCYRSWSCELCYECVDCFKCYDAKFLQNCENCHSSWFLKNCIGCQDCFGSVNLRNKQYYFLNEKCTKDEYTQKLAELELYKYSKLKQMRSQFLAYAKTFPQRYMQGVQNEKVTGDYLTNSKNAIECFDSGDLWDCKHVNQTFGSVKDSMDCTEVGIDVELAYQCCYMGSPAKNVMFSACNYPKLVDSTYCIFSQQGENLFGCIGARKMKYCILNKQYTEAEYKELVPKIIAYMKKTGEWGQFFPARISPVAYNESIASDYYPLSQEEAERRGYKWKKEESKARYDGPKCEVPDSIEEVDSSLLKSVLTCGVTGKNYRIIPQELKFYQDMNLPIPRISPDERHRQRHVLRNPRKLWNRTCSECECDIRTSYAPEREEQVLCEKCYQEVVD